jgi:hypothetical protein
MNDENVAFGVKHAQVRLTDQEYDSLLEAARRDGLKLQPYLRNLIIAATQDGASSASSDPAAGLNARQRDLVRAFCYLLRTPAGDRIADSVKNLVTLWWEDHEEEIERQEQRRKLDGSKGSRKQTG